MQLACNANKQQLLLLLLLRPPSALRMRISASCWFHISPVGSTKLKG
jgi:hypothetical protein